MKSAIDIMQDKINEITIQRNTLIEQCKDARAQLYHVANHLSEYSKGRLQNELIAIAEEVLPARE